METAGNSLKMTVMAQGLDIAPWGISAKLTALDLQADVRTRLRPAVMGNLAELNMIGWNRQPLSPLLAAGHPEACARFAELVRFLAAHAYGLQVVVHPNEHDKSVDNSIDVSPTGIKEMLPKLYEMGSVMAFVRARSPHSTVLR